MVKHEELRKRISKVADTLLSRGVATKDEIRGCSTREIKEIEAAVKRPLPAAYRLFLAKMGREAGRFYEGTDLYYPVVLRITAAAHELVAKHEADIVLPEDAIVIWMHQGYRFMFIRADEGDDPPPYHYMEMSGRFVKLADQLSQFLLDVAYDEW